MTPEAFADQYGVSEPAMARLRRFDAVLLDWSSRQNLIARSTIEERWARHYADGAQLFRLIPNGAKTLVDLGSGAGFPGLVLAALGAEHNLRVTLVESTGKKVAFLRAAAEAMDLSGVEVLPQRIESTTISPPNVITARALARLPKLCEYASVIAGQKTVCLFPKGQDVEFELTEAAKYWHMSVEQIPSLTSAGSSILVVKNLKAKPSAKGSGDKGGKRRTR